jgi:hypothetical protein
MMEFKTPAEKQVYETKLAALRAAIDEGDASGVAEGDVFARVRAKLREAASFDAKEGN